MTVWDLRQPLRRAVLAGLPEAEVSAAATSTFTAGTIDSALLKLSGKTDAESVRQREYLLELRQRKFGR